MRHKLEGDTNNKKFKSLFNSRKPGSGRSQSKSGIRPEWARESQASHKCQAPVFSVFWHHFHQPPQRTFWTKLKGKSQQSHWFASPKKARKSDDKCLCNGYNVPDTVLDALLNPCNPHSHVIMRKALLLSLLYSWGNREVKSLAQT